MTYQDELPARVRVLILGGGIHGVGVLHDVASRGWRDVHLVEKGRIGDGTSSKSTKLIHGGLRYLRRLGDFGLVAEALKERRVLMQLAPDLVRPVELLFPLLRKGGMPRPMIKAGLMLYDRLAGRQRLGTHQFLPPPAVAERAPILDRSKVTSVYSFWDAQTDDLGLVGRVAASAHKLGAGISEGVAVERMTQSEDGWNVVVRTRGGERRTISALYVVNALGPWAHTVLEASGIVPTHRAVNNKGVHLLFDDLGLKAGLFLQSLKGDGRIFFLLPWQGYTLLGTTESLYRDDPDALGVDPSEVAYLLDNCNAFLTRQLTPRDVRRTFAGLRWLALENGHSLTETSRAYDIGERPGKRGILLTIYGGKLTTYRNLAASIGDRITTHFGEFRRSRTEEPGMWLAPAEAPGVEGVLERFAAKVS
jgi:glycerol-3-phosphate dehydrogenase